MKQAQLSYLQVCALKIACQSVKKCVCRFHLVCRMISWRNDFWSKCRCACATKEGFPAYLILRPLAAWVRVIRSLVMVHHQLGSLEGLQIIVTG